VPLVWPPGNERYGIVGPVDATPVEKFKKVSVYDNQIDKHLSDWADISIGSN